MQHGKIGVQTGHKLISQWESKYISQILPFVIPFMVSGPDYSFHEKTNRWRRRDDPRSPNQIAPLVSANKFTSAFARRCESQCRQDWNALPIIRSVNFRYAVETGNTMVSVPLWWKRGSAVQLSAQEHANRYCGTATSVRVTFDCQSMGTLQIYTKRKASPSQRDYWPSVLATWQVILVAPKV